MNLVNTAAPTLQGGAGFTLLGAVSPEAMTHAPGILIAIVTGIVQLITLFKKQKK